MIKVFFHILLVWRGYKVRKNNSEKMKKIRSEAAQKEKKRKEEENRQKEEERKRAEEEMAATSSLDEELFKLQQSVDELNRTDSFGTDKPIVPRIRPSISGASEKPRIKHLLPKEFRQALKTKQFPLSRPIDATNYIVPFISSLRCV